MGTDLRAHRALRKIAPRACLFLAENIPAGGIAATPRFSARP